MNEEIQSEFDRIIKLIDELFAEVKDLQKRMIGAESCIDRLERNKADN